MADPPRTPDPRERRRLILSALARPALTALVLVSVYFSVPLDQVTGLSDVLLLVGGGVVVLLVGGWQVHRILAAEYPAVQAIEALISVVSLHLVLFATVYLRMSIVAPDNFSEPLSRIDALYFCLTVFATVGFGDISAESEAARAVVSVQMVANLIFFAVGIRLLAAAVQWRRRSRGDDEG
ncbi:ion channel family protein [Rhodococcus sp. BUPNP1]|nr:ion channel family protein [Rhodococcus sp. BUPNP1]